MDADVHVVVVMDEGLNDVQRPRQTHLRPDEHKFCARSNESVYEVLGASSLDLPGFAWSALAPVPARVVDVDIQSVLVRRMTEPSEALAEIATVGSAEIANTHPGYLAIFRNVSPKNAKDDPNQAIGAEATIRPVGRYLPDRIPSEKRATLARKPNSICEAAIPGSAQRDRPTPTDPRKRPGISRGSARRSHRRID
jgi:hypothetical protein